MTAITDTLTCSECEQPITRDVDAALDDLYGPYQWHPSGLADELRSYLELYPEATDSAALAVVLPVWLGYEPAALVAAVRHYLSETV